MMYDDKEDKNKLTVKELKEKVNAWFQYFRLNIKRFNDSTKFTSKTTLDDNTVTNLIALGKPVIEFNAISQEISRQRGEFAMNEPSFEIGLEDGFMFQDLPETILPQMEFIVGHVRHELSNQNNDMLQYRTITQQFQGGYSAWEIKEEYASKRSMEKKLRLKMTFHPTLTGFDPTARDSHKGDGDYAFELVPIRKQEYEERFGKHKKNESFYPKYLGDVTWSYKNMNEDMVLICYFYCKKKKKVKYIQLTDGQLMTKKEYDKFVMEWEENRNDGIPPIPTGNDKTEMIDIIYRYVFSECGIHEYEKTDLPMLPYIFVDGDSEILSNNMGEFEQFTKPLAYHAMGAQRLKDLLGQTAAYEVESWVQSPFMVARQALDDLPQPYLEDWLTPQKKSLLVYNAMYKGNEESAIPPPIQIQKQQTPQILTQLFFQMDIMIQHIMGSHDAQLSKQGANMSGVSQKEAMKKASATAKPYVISNTAAMERVADFYMHWMERNMVNQRIAPIIDDEGKKDMRPINSSKTMRQDGQPVPGNIDLSFKADMFKIKVKPGNSVEVQKELALESMRNNAQAFPSFAGLVNEYGLEVILNNIDAKDVDILKAKAPDYMEGVRAQKEEMAKKQPLDPISAQIKIAEMQEQSGMAKAQMQEETKRMKIQSDMQAKQAELAIKKQDVDTKFMKEVANISIEESSQALEAEKVDASLARTAVMELQETHKIKHQTNRELHDMILNEKRDRREHEIHIKGKNTEM